MLSVGFLQLAKQLIRAQTVSAMGTVAAADLLQGISMLRLHRWCGR